MTALRVLLLMLGLTPSRGEADTLFRLELAVAIAQVPEEHTQDVLVRIAFYESGFRQDIADCRTLGDRGRSRGVFQVQPRTPLERVELCGPVDEQVRIAVSRIEESLTWCGDLSGYTAGRCDRGNRAAKVRWGK